MSKLLRDRNFYLGLLIVVLALGLRLWKIDQYMNFLGDEGRDALIVTRIITQGDWPFIGPPTSVGNMYLGPLYYYLMLIPMWVSGSNPVSAAVMVAFFGSAAVGLVFWLGKRWFGVIGGVVAALLYAISPVTITYSRSSWNPNPAPFFSLVLFLAMDLAHRRGQYLWWCVVGGALAAVLQMHYLALALVPVVGLIWLYEFFDRRKKSSHNFWLGTISGIGVFLLMMSPLVLFDFKHNFLNLRAFETLISGQGSNVGEKGILMHIWPIFQDKLISRYVTGNNQILAVIVCSLIIVVLVRTFYYWWKKKLNNWPVGVLSVWLLVSLVVVTFYHGPIYDHYLGFLSPAPYLLLAALVAFFQRPMVKYLIAGLALIVLGYANLIIIPLKYSPNNQLARTQEVVDYIARDAEGSQFNFALMSDFNYDAAYQFILKKDALSVQQLPFVKTDTLYVVCENAVCQPIGNDKFEIAAFGWAKIDWERNVAGVKIYKLVPNLDQAQN